MDGIIPYAAHTELPSLGPPTMTAWDSRNIVLTGFMGTGKTTVGRLLAGRLGYELVDTDRVIEQHHGRIAEIFGSQGEEAFRRIEREVAAELSDRERLVISTGGRMMLDPQNVATLSRNGRVFCLVAGPDEIFDRIKSDPSPTERPLLSVPDPRQRIVELLAERSPAYRRFAQLSTDGVSPDAVAAALAALARSEPNRFAVSGPGGTCEYSVGAAVLPMVRQLAEIHGPVVVVTDADAGALYAASFGDVDLTVTLPSDVSDALADAGIERSATIVSIGDSGVGEVAAGAAATYRGGLDLVHCPTDLVSMLDTPVGETGTVGAAKRPRAVVADVATLQSSSDRQFASGMAEVVRRGLLAGSHLVDQLEGGDWRGLTRLAPDALTRLQTLVADAIRVGIEIRTDPARDLGHSFTRAFEQVGGGLLSHGEAVGLGLVATARLSEQAGLAVAGLGDRVESLVARVGLTTALPTRMSVDAVIEAIHDRAAGDGGEPWFVLLHDVGDPVVTDAVAPSTLEKVLTTLQPVTPP